MQSRVVCITGLFFLFAMGRLSAWGEQPSAPARVDRYGDPLPAGAMARLGTSCLRQGHRIDSLAFSPDGKVLAAAGDGPVCLWDPRTGRQIRSLPAEFKENRCIAFCPDGKLFATAISIGEQSGIHLWDPGSGKKWRTLAAGKPVESVAFSSDGKTLASTGPGRIQLWETASGKLLRSFGPGGGECVAFSPNGKTLAVGGIRGVGCTLWDVATGKQMRRLDGPEFWRLTFSPDSKLLVSGEYGAKDVHLWDAARGTILHSLKGHTEWVTAFAFSPDGKRLATGGRDQTIRCWEIATGKELFQLPRVRCWVRALAFSPDGRTLASAGDSVLIQLWDTEKRKELLPRDETRDRVDSLALSADGKTLFAGSLDGIAVWETASARKSRVFSVEKNTSGHLALSPDGKTFAVAEWEKVIHLRDSASGRELRCVEAGHGVKRLAFSPDGRSLAVDYWGGASEVYEIASGKRNRKFSWQRADWIAFAPTGKFLVASREYAIALCDASSGKGVHELTLPEGDWRELEEAAFSPDGRTLAGVFRSQGVHLWDILTGQPLFSLTDKEKARPRCLAFSPDGRLLACGDWNGGIHVWDLAARRSLGVWPGHRGQVNALVFFPDSRRIASASNDTTVLIWDVSDRLSKREAGGLSKQELQALWSDLDDADADKAEQAIWRLADASRQSVPFLRERLRPMARIDSPGLERLVADLDSEQFAVREKATGELIWLGDLALPQLHKVLASRPTLEHRQRVEYVLAKVNGPFPPVEHRRTLRALAVLEYAGSREARQTLEALAGGMEGAWLTREAKARWLRLKSPLGR